MTPLPLQTQPAYPGEVENETGGRYSNKEHCRVPMTLPQHWDIVLRLNLCHQKDRTRERERLWDGGLRARGLRCQLSLSLTLSPVGQVNSLCGDGSGAGVWPASLKMALVHSCHVAFFSPAVCPLSWTQLVLRRANIFMEWPTLLVHGSFICRAQNSFVTL